MKELGKKITNVILWVLVVLLALIGLALLITGSWSGILAILSAVAIAPILKKWIPIKTWQQVIACFVLFFAAFALSPSINSTESLDSQVFEIKFDTGEYVGKISDKKPTGTGTLTYTDFGEYKGSFQEGKRNGTGSFTWKNGDVYTGEWKNDKIDGKGTITFNDGSKLIATFDSNKITSGNYTWTDDNGTYKMHVANSSDFEPVYTLEATYSNGISYKGPFSDGNLNGKGTMIYPDIGTYIGGFENGKKSGDGQFIWDDGDKFSGTWVNDGMNGQGQYSFANGSTLHGNFESNVPQGTLTYTYQGETYNTIWSNGTCTSITKA